MTGIGALNHGTYGAYQQHVLAGDTACEACRRAAAAYGRKRRRHGRCAPGLGWPLGPGDIAPRDRPSRNPRRSTP